MNARVSPGSLAPVRRPAVFCVGLGAVSLLLSSAPTYDPWAWLTWGREVAHGSLSTPGGPAWKPLPVAVTALLSGLGDLAPDAWLVVARAGAALALVAAFALARRLAGGSVAAGAGAAAAVALCDGFAWHAAVGNSEGLLLACGLLAGERALARRPRQALALGVAAALLRPEAWPFLAVLAAWAWRVDERARPAIAAGAVALPAAWILPEWIGSGDPWRGSARARVPNPGAPALADVPALESLRRAVAIPPLPALAAAAVAGLAAARVALSAVAGLAWIAIVAAMSQLGYSGEERYLLPGAALVALSGGAAIGQALASLATTLGRSRPVGTPGAIPAGRVSAPAGDVPAGQVPGARIRPRERSGAAPVAVVAALALTGLVAPFVVSRARDALADVRASAREARLLDGLDDALAAAGGRERVLRCGRPYVGPLRGPALAWRLRVPKRRVGFAPRAPGVAFVSRLPGRAAAEPRTPPGFRLLARAGGWRVLARCAR